MILGLDFRGDKMSLAGTINTELWAVLLGATDSMLSLTLPYGYELKRLKLKDTPICDEIMTTNGKLDVKYLASNLGSVANPEFIFVYKSSNGIMPIECFTLNEMMTGNDKASLFFDEVTGNQNIEIFRILSFLRLIQEGNIEVADKFYFIHANYACNKINSKKTSSHDLPISVYEDLYEWNVDKSNIFQELAALPVELIEKLDDVFERFGRGYSASRFDDAYKNLVTLSEIILIGYNSNDRSGGKKDKFANRLAVAIAEDADVQTVHDEAMQMYKERSNETHEGKNQNITKEELSKLRCSVRKMIMKFIDFCKSNYGSIADKSFEGLKREYVLGLLTRIDTLRTNGFLH